MRVLVASTAGAGHFAPMVPFADACRRAGHDVLVATPRSFAATVERAGFDFWPCDDIPEEEWARVQALLPTLPPDEAQRLVVGEVFGRLDARAMFPRVLEAMDEWRPDIVLRETVEFGSYVAAESRDIPHVQAAVGLESFEELMLDLVYAPVAELRASVGLDPDKTGARLRGAPCVSLVPPSMEDASGSGPERARFRERDVAGDHAPLPDWWGTAGGPLVYLTFGSVAGTIPFFATVYQAVVGALASVPARLLVTTGEGFDPQSLGPLPDNVHVERWVPQARVLREADAMVCHGGFNSVLGGFVTGVPMVVVPLFADQPENAARVAALGAGLSVEGGPQAAPRVPEAVERVLANGSYRSGAERIAGEIAALPPVDDAVPLLESIAGR